MRTGPYRRKIIISAYRSILPSLRGYYDAVNEISRAGADVKALIEAPHDLDMSIDMWHAFVLEEELNLAPSGKFIAEAAVVVPISASTLRKLQAVGPENYGICREAAVKVAVHLRRASIEVENEHRMAIQDDHVLSQLLAIELDMSKSRDTRQSRKKRRDRKLHKCKRQKTPAFMTIVLP
ncbi:hypothetical protein BDV97DRAFT_366681 [Delphinella strobiligena]|nr:hypothetical protein BDV97DRAFT_366681 [Delphinella strobiligena]